MGKVIAIANVIPNMQLMLHEHIKFVEIQIAQPLAHVITNGYIPFTVNAVNNIADNRNHVFILDFLFYYVH